MRHESSPRIACVCGMLAILATAGPTLAARIAIPDGFPAAATTGYSGTLTDVSSQTVTVAGTVLENLRISGGVQVKANNVTIRNCYIIGGLYGVNASYGYTGLLVEDCTIYNGTSKGVYGRNMTIRRCDISQYSDCMLVQSNVLVEDCYLHDLKITDGSHNDGIQSTGGNNITIRRCTIQAQYQQQTSALIFQTNNSGIDNVLFEDNFLSGGTYTVYIKDKGTGYGAPTNVRMIGNVIEYDGYQFGHLTYDGAVEFSCNIFHTGDPIPQNPACTVGPTADAGGDQNVTDTAGYGWMPVTLVGSASSAGSAPISAYLWSEDGAYVGEGVTKVAVLPVGVHTITLKVTDANGKTDTDEVVITVLAGSPGRPGDANGDGQVDLEDFVILKTTFGQSPLLDDRADFDGDGDVDLEDFVILKTNFGS